MLKVNADERINACDILVHEWVTGGVNKPNRAINLNEMSLEIDFRDLIKEETSKSNVGRL